jgi:hypothetical protein
MQKKSFQKWHISIKTSFEESGVVSIFYFSQPILCFSSAYDYIILCFGCTHIYCNITIPL